MSGRRARRKWWIGTRRTPTCEPCRAHSEPSQRIRHGVSASLWGRHNHVQTENDTTASSPRHPRSAGVGAVRASDRRRPGAIPGRRSDHRQRPRRHSIRTDHVPAGRAGVHRSRQGLQRRLHRARDTRRRAGASLPRATSAPAPRSCIHRRPSRRRPCFRTSTSTKGCRSTTVAWSRRSPIRVCGTRWACGSASRTPASSTRSRRSTFVVSARSHARAASMHIRRRDRCRRMRHRRARRSGVNRTRSSARRSSTRNTAAIRTSQTLPMYCVTASFKDPYDTKDMRTTANNDVNFAMDVPPFDSTIVAQLRAKGAIIYAKSVAAEFNGGPGNPGGDAKAHDRAGQRRAADELLEWPALQPVRHDPRAARHQQRFRRRGRRRTWSPSASASRRPRRVRDPHRATASR